jgi:preprotein translocase subunit SecG
MKLFLEIATIIISIILVVLVLLQGKGAGLGSAWGGGGEMYQTRRGVEKFTMQATVVFVIIFFVIGAIAVFVK